MKRKKIENPAVNNHTGTLSTFAGVFTPSILTILGIILFLRLGYVAGNAGLGRTLLILLLANGISVLTSISLSAIATNIKVKGGGDYYLISRTLGLEFGGAIGIVLFLAQSVSIGFYCIGFGEVAAQLFPPSLIFSYLPQLIAILAVGCLFILAWLGADWATRFQYVVMAILVGALASFFAGGFIRWNTSMLIQNWTAPENAPGFWVLFAIFFPAVTGFTQGVSMSGDLKDAGKSLPLGTFLAVGISIVVYFLASVVFCAALPQSVLASDYNAMQRIAVYGFMITAGVVAATLSSAMASFLGAPRILQSLAGDRIFPFLTLFAKGVGPASNPRRAILLAGGIACATIGLGNLNLIASVVSMFFLISYGLLNYATFFETRAASPFFRPRFRWYHGRLSLLGGVSCLGAMLAINTASGLVAVAVLFSIYQYLRRTAGPARWADGKRSYHLQQVRNHLLAAASEPEHPRDWRPQILLFSDNIEKRETLLKLASWIAGDSGLITVVQIIEAKGAQAIKLQGEAETALKKGLAASGINAFSLVATASNLDQGVDTLVQSSGIGPLKANTILFSWFSRDRNDRPHIRQMIYSNRLRMIFRQGRNIVVLDEKPDAWQKMEAAPETERRIDVWWWNDATGRLMLLLSHLITRVKDWDEARIRVLSADMQPETEKETESLKDFLDDVRIKAEAVELVQLTADIVVEYSADASLVFLPFQLKGNMSVDPFGEPVEAILNRLPSVALVLAAEDIDLDAEPEEGIAGEMAAVMDDLSEAEKKALKAEKEAEKASRAFDEKLGTLEKTEASEADESKVMEVRSEVFKAEADAEKASRKAVKADVKAQQAAQEAEALGIKLPDKKEEEPPGNEITEDPPTPKLP
jgi:amino acid transporter